MTGVTSSQPTLLALDSRRGWRKRVLPYGTVHAAGDPAAEAAIVSLLSREVLPTAADVAAAVAPVRGLWALLFDGKAGVIAAVDHVRSLPLFYARSSHGTVVGDDAHGVARAAGVQKNDPVAAEELALAGYTTGSRTLLVDLSQLVAGEVVAWSASGAPVHARHHKYHPTEDEGAPAVAPHELGAALDAAFDRLVAKADGHPIGVPLSGGLDSRLVLAKLVERSYRPLFAFSYGPKRNSDAEIARLVAERLGVTWQFVVTPGADIRTFYKSSARSDYWRFADGLASVPNMQDVLPLAAMREAQSIPPDAIIVNGQTGDFISGGHIPDHLIANASVPPAQLFDALIDKHFSLWRSLLDQPRREKARKRIARALGVDPAGLPLTRAVAAAFFESFEYAERQAKFVVNGQRAYEWYGFGWHLPLWDRDIVDLFGRAPLSDRFGQSLYRRYLETWDYRGVFSGVNRRVTAWPRVTSALLAPVAVALRFAVGRTRRDHLFRYLNYFDRFGDHYKAFGFREFAKYAHDARNPAAFYVRSWLRENGVALEHLPDA